MADYDLVVLGAGPGGYVAAIRAAQLGMTTAVIEREAVGGVCLNWGCIPTKSLLRNAEVLNLIKNAEEFGISFDNLRYDFGVAIDRSRKVVERLTSGVELLLKKNGVEQIIGSGVLTDPSTVQVDTGQTLSTDNVIIATGGKERVLPTVPVDGLLGYLLSEGEAPPEPPTPQPAPSASAPTVSAPPRAPTPRTPGAVVPSTPAFLSSHPRIERGTDPREAFYRHT